MKRLVRLAPALCVSICLVLCTGVFCCLLIPSRRTEARVSSVQGGNPDNVALASNGAVASASSYFSAAYTPSAVNDGDRTGVNWGNGGGWNDSSADTYPDWVEIDFNGSKTIGEIDVFTLQDNFVSGAQPTQCMTFSAYGITAFDVQYGNGAGWATVPHGSVTGNNLVWRKFVFSSITTSKIRVVVNNGLLHNSRIVEIEAYQTQSSSVNVALTSNGAVATASGQFSAAYPVTAVNDGDRKGASWGNGGGWNDDTADAYPDWVQIDFNCSRTIGEVDVFTLQDNYSNAAEPSPCMTFSLYGITDFDVRVPNGNDWVNVPGGSVTGNTLVWRKVVFSTSITTSKIRIFVNNAFLHNSRIVEIEAYELQTDNIPARIDPINRTGEPGEDLFSGNFNWGLPVLGLAGRAGLDLGLSLVWNSLVWRRSGSTIEFDADRGFPAPSFRLGFPSIQQQAYTSQSGSNALLMIMPSGRRVELRQLSATPSLYESADSSWLQLDTSVNPTILRTADGTQLSFQLSNGEYHCTQVKDRNGNYITFGYDSGGHITTITDTLGRVITFVYSNGNLQKITQPWNGVDHNLAQFEYTNLTIQTSFSGLSVVGPANGTSINVLSKVTLDDNSYFTFDYTSYGQVKKISHKAPTPDDHLLASTAYDMDTSAGQTDCPRFTKRTDYAENWNGGNTVDTLFSFDRGSGFGQVTLSDGTVVKESHAVSGCSKGLTTRVDTYSSDNLTTPKKTVAITWTQDNASLTYPQNPRVTQTDVTDDASNLRRTTISYSSLTLPSGTVCRLPSDTREYAADGITLSRKQHTDYLTTSAYLSQHIIGLPSARFLYDSETGTALSKVTFGYDASVSASDTSNPPDPTIPVQHDSTYWTTFLTRGNLTSVKRWDVTTLGSPNEQSVTSTMTYNTAGDLLSSADPSGHQVRISYTDSFAATDTSHSGSTLAYPTTVTDPDNYSSTAQYDYDLGTAKMTTDPKGATLTRTFDSAGRVTKIESNLADSNSNKAYTRFVYPTSMTEVDTYVLQTGATQTASAVEIYSAQFTDGAGRVIGTLRKLPNSTGGYSGQKFVYDVMGRASQQSNPTEIADPTGLAVASWTPSGDDATAGWQYTYQSYDWKGRPRVTTNTDSTTRSVTYGGCGCAGGEVVTIQDEVGRQQRLTYDVLGRLGKAEALNTDANHTVYATRTNSYNARDQIMRIYVQQGSSGTGQETLMTYDGYGRLATRKAPIETSATIYSYYSDDTVQKVTDPRGASGTYTYNGRHLVTGITYAKPASSAPVTGPAVITPAPTVAFGYDDAGNRLWMTDGLGQVDYVHDTWSRLTSETRTFNDFPGSTYPLTYDYNLAGGLTKLTDPFGAVVSYAFNQVGQVTSVAATGLPASQFASGMLYRAWGGLKHGSYGGNGIVDVTYNGRLQMTRFAQGSLGSDYQYYADGRVSFASNLLNNTFDRSYSYDHIGRLVQGLTGTEARGGTTADGPYKQSYQYDVFDNLTSRTNRFWSQPDDLFTASFVNDRNSAWQYNGSGDVVLDTMTHQYDMAGRQTRAFDAYDGIDQSYDGDGQPAKRVESRPSFNSTIYYLRSSVLRGQVVTEVYAAYPRSGTHKTHVYVNGAEIALYDSWLNQVLWRMSNPVTGSGWQELDPLGGFVGSGDPFVQNPNTTYSSLHTGDGTYLEDGNPFDPGSGCTLDGMPISCALAADRVANGSTAIAPVRSAVPVWYKGEVTLAFFQAFADGYQGYVPVTARYAGEGHITSINPPKRSAPRLGGYNGAPSNKGDWAGADTGDDDPEVMLARSTWQQGKGRVFKNHKPSPGPEAQDSGAAAAAALEELNKLLGPLGEEAAIKKGNELGYIMNLNGTMHFHTPDGQRPTGLFYREYLGHYYYPPNAADYCPPGQRCFIRGQPCNTYPNGLPTGCWYPDFERDESGGSIVRAPKNPAPFYYFNFKWP